ncbi:MAG: protein translocase subunit SecD [Candidatus Colwellbacteria bacterium]|jgi:protein-export membrane protein SecD|nr:protein translocase subunit SecD [Candidatus Colwellbacteria bacterium]MCK9497699.1 protein translocase subunit SecD [Candidatus Colwellbacteria bacterium]MDD4818997.1 protein translocase subunit SecD [Candidatus Colwellbacteria bacterium]
MKNKILFLLAVLVVGLSAVFFALPKSQTGIAGLDMPDVFLNRYMPWRLGLDLVGGTALTYDVDLLGVEKSDVDVVLNGLKDVIEKRINLYGVSEPRLRVVEKGDKKQLLVELAGIKEIGDAVKEIGETPYLDFREGCTFSEDALECMTTGLSGRHVEKATLAISSQGVSVPVVELEFNEEGARLFEEITERNVGEVVAIFLDNNLIEAPVVSEKIVGGKAQISGEGITLESAKILVERFNAGALSAPIKLANQRTVNATAAEDSLNRIILAGFAGLVLIVLFMIGYYRGWGLIASLALIFYVAFTLAVFKLIPGFAMTLAGITGFVLSIGAAVDANILIFERAKEEIKKGVDKLSAVESGFRFAWSSIRDSNISTIITSLILYLFTTSFVKGFALTLMVGIIINLATTFLVTRNLLRVFISSNKAKIISEKSK